MPTQVSHKRTNVPGLKAGRGRGRGRGPPGGGFYGAPAPFYGGRGGGGYGYGAPPAYRGGRGGGYHGGAPGGYVWLAGRGAEAGPRRKEGGTGGRGVVRSTLGFDTRISLRHIGQSSNAVMVTATPVWTALQVRASWPRAGPLLRALLSTHWDRTR